MSIVLGPHPRVTPDPDADVIVGIRAFVIGTKETEEAAGGGADCHSQVRITARAPTYPVPETVANSGLLFRGA